MNEDNRIIRDTTALKNTKLLIRKNTKKNTNSHEKHPLKRGAKNRCMLEGLRAARDSALSEKMRGLVYKDNTPSHDINNLLNHLPETVFIYSKEDDKDTGIPLKFSAWRGVDNDIVKPYFYQLTLSWIEEASNHEYRLTPFVFNESKTLTIAFKRQKLCRVDFMRGRLQKLLNEALQRPNDNKIAFWFAYETACRGQPHYQGSMLIRQNEEMAVKKAIYKLNGKMTARELLGCYRSRFNKRINLSNESSALYTDLNWSDYNLKERGYTKMYHNDFKRVVAVTQPLIKHTECYYNLFRTKFNKKSLITIS